MYRIILFYASHERNSPAQTEALNRMNAWMICSRIERKSAKNREKRGALKEKSVKGQTTLLRYNRFFEKDGIWTKTRCCF